MDQKNFYRKKAGEENEEASKFTTTAFVLTFFRISMRGGGEPPRCTAETIVLLINFKFYFNAESFKKFQSFFCFSSMKIEIKLLML